MTFFININDNFIKIWFSTQVDYSFIHFYNSKLLFPVECVQHHLKLQCEAYSLLHAWKNKHFSNYRYLQAGRIEQTHIWYHGYRYVQIILKDSVISKSVKTDGRSDNFLGRQIQITSLGKCSSRFPSPLH